MKLIEELIITTQRVVIFRIIDPRRFQKYPADFGENGRGWLGEKREIASNEREKRIDEGVYSLGMLFPDIQIYTGRNRAKCSTVDEVLFSSLHLEFFHIYTYIGRIESFSSTFFKNILPLLDLFLDRVKRLILLLKNCSYVTKYKLITLLIQFYRYSKE